MIENFFLKFEAEGQEFAKFLKRQESITEEPGKIKNVNLLAISNRFYIPVVLHSAHVYPLDPEYVSAILNAWPWYS